MHDHEYAQSASVRARMLRKQDLLHHVSGANRTNNPALNEGTFRSTEHRRDRDTERHNVADRNGKGAAIIFQWGNHRAFTVCTRADLYSSHLIQRA